MPSAITWLHFLGSLVVPKNYIETVGAETFAARPIGSGPYRLVEHELNVRSVLEANERSWGGIPKIKRPGGILQKTEFPVVKREHAAQPNRITLRRFALA